ncbi:MAG: hypothetical protein AAGF95_29385 [Chloroflexota bacterium]
MGLDITSCSRVEFVELLYSVADWEARYVEDEETPADIFCLVNDREYPQRVEPLPIPESGIAVYRIAGEVWQFRAGPYSYYNQWRWQLCAMATGMTPKQIRQTNHTEVTQALPFYSLIDFSDADGIIGPDTSRILSEQFAQFQPQADVVPDTDFRELYGDFRKAFELASEQGVVLFH